MWKIIIVQFFEYISGTYLVTYLPQRYCVYPIWYLRHLKGTKIVQTSQLWKQATHEFGIVFWVSLAADYFEFLMGHLLGFVQHPKIEIKNWCQIEFKQNITLIYFDVYLFHSQKIWKLSFQVGKKIREFYRILLLL